MEGRKEGRKRKKQQQRINEKNAGSLKRQTRFTNPWQI
jgi:hypothetical protein